MLQQTAEEAAKGQTRVQEQQNAAREAFQQASAHARSAQQAEARCRVLEQAVQRAECNAEASSHLQQVRPLPTQGCTMSDVMHTSCKGCGCGLSVTAQQEMDCCTCLT